MFCCLRAPTIGPTTTATAKCTTSPASDETSSQLFDSTASLRAEARQRRGVCWHVLVGDNSTERGRRTQTIKVVCLTVVPIVVLLIETAQVVYQCAMVSTEASKVNGLVHESAEFRRVLHALQRERSMLAMYAGIDHTAASRMELERSRTRTDLAIAGMTRWPSAVGYTRRELLDTLNRHRASLVAADTIDAATASNLTTFYGTMVTDIVAWIRSVSKQVTVKEVLEAMIAYYNLMLASEEASLMQGIGSSYFVNG